MHSLTRHAATLATCTAAGNSEYWQCNGCKAYFGDAGGMTEITLDDTVQAIHTATMQKVEASTPTCAKSGNTAYWMCTACEQYFTSENASEKIDDKSSVILTVDHPSTYAYNHTLHWITYTCACELEDGTEALHDFDTQGNCICGYHRND